MPDSSLTFEIHRLTNEGYSQRKIAQQLQISRSRVKRALDHPLGMPKKKYKPRTSKLEPWYPQIQEFLKLDPQVSATVIYQMIREQGFEGKYTIVRQYVKKQRPQASPPRAYLRFESPPGEQLQIDWGHFGSVAYGQTSRRLYAMAVVEGHSRKLFVNFSHSQDQATLQQALFQAFNYFGGTPKKIVFDNMKTAVIEREGPVIRFNATFLEFLRPFQITPHACNPRAPYEKGKVERVISYVRQNFWPLREFTDLTKLNQQVYEWMETIANRRLHQTTGQIPAECFSPEFMRPLPEHLPDYRQSVPLKVHKDFSVLFDTNSYSVPPFTIGQILTLKASQSEITLYLKERKIAWHSRCWERRKRIENPQHRKEAIRYQKQFPQKREIALFASLSDTCRQFLEGLASHDRPIGKSVRHLLKLRDEYGTPSLVMAVERALRFKAYASDYVENILYQEMTPQRNHPLVSLQKEELNQIQLTEPSLAQYDAIPPKRRIQ